MHFLKWPNSLWFFQAGQGQEVQKEASLAGTITASVANSITFTVESGSVIPFSISAGYFISGSTHDVRSVDIELSSFAYNLTASVSQSTFVHVNVTGGILDGLNAFLTATPVFVLDQSGQEDKSASAAFNITASATASITPFITVSAAYNVTASATASVLIADVISVSAAYNITASTAFILNISQGQLDKNVGAAYGLTASISPALRIGRGGGLVWSRKRKRRIPVRIGSVNTV